MKYLAFILLLFPLLSSSCVTQDVEEIDINAWTRTLPAHFDKLPVPEKNPMNMAKVELGARLFYDPLLSKDSSVSCASCHFPALSFSDGKKRSVGIGDSLGLRNSPVLVNLAYANSYMMDGGIPSLELQVVAPLMHEGEMGFDLFQLAERFEENTLYQSLSIVAFERGLDPEAIAYALAAFQRSLLSYESKYDDMINGSVSLSDSEKRGFDLFFSDSLNCAACHNGIGFSDYKFYNLGLYKDYEDKGRWRITEDVKDIGKFKTPTLRNIMYSSPYMHDGSIKNLMDLIEFKMTGGVDHPNKSGELKGFYLNESDKKALISFLGTLSDPNFIEREIKREQSL